MKFLKEERGQAAVFMAVFLALLALGFMALAVDVGYFFHEKRMAQSAADAAAVAAAEEYSSNNSANAQNVANAIAGLNGFKTTLATNPATATIHNPPVYGMYAGASGYTEVIVSRPINTLLLGAFNPSRSQMSVSARAVAGGWQGGATCICLEEPTGMGLSMSNNAQISASSCGVEVDSASSNAVGVVGSANINVTTLGTVSTSWDNGSNINNNGTISPSTKVVTGIAACSPTLAAPTLPNGTPCYSNPIQGWTAANHYTGVYTLPLSGETTIGSTVCYTSLDTSDSASVTFTPGYTYYIQGNFTTGGGAPLTGNGVEFFVGGTVNIANGVTAKLSAPTVSGVPQTLFYVDGNSIVIQGGSSSAFSGMMYAPNAAITLNNGTGTTLNMEVVGQSLAMSGGATLTSYAGTNLGTLNSSTAKLAE